MSDNSIVHIYTSPESDAEMTDHRSRLAIAAIGLEGDRYSLGTGYYSGVSEWDAQVTLMAIEPFEALERDHACILDPIILRRNLITRGIDLKSLIGREFKVGPEVVLRGRKAWPPCSYIVQRSGRTEIFRYLSRDSGIGADVVVGGRITIGDSIEI
jgi:MOSC domain-containing protein YiiM